jgi:hypothetical protein
MVSSMQRRSKADGSNAQSTWNDAPRIAQHRALSPAERLRLTIEASRATLRFAQGRRRER